MLSVMFSFDLLWSFRTSSVRSFAAILREYSIRPVFPWPKIHGLGSLWNKSSNHFDSESKHWPIWRPKLFGLSFAKTAVNDICLRLNTLNVLECIKFYFFSCFRSQRSSNCLPTRESIKLCCWQANLARGKKIFFVAWNCLFWTKFECLPRVDMSLNLYKLASVATATILDATQAI